MSNFENKKLTCEDCGTEFVWDASEQAFFAKKGFKKIPKRCRACRAKKQKEIEAEKANEREVVCAKCGAKGTIRETLTPEEEALCFDCYLKEQEK